MSENGGRENSDLTGSKYPLAICLMGPTASGKTALAVELAQRLPCDIISVDSALVYRDMHIGSAKPDADTLRVAPHQLIDLLDPAESYSAAQFRADALAAMQHSLAAGRIPLLVGGTMLYFKALLFGLAAMPPADTAVRADISALAQAHGWGHIHQLLAEVDPQTAARLQPSDTQRLQRALEVYRVSGKPLSAWHQQQPDQGDQKQARSQWAADLPCQPLCLAITPHDRAVLHQRIAQRFEQMLAAGLVDEVRALHQRGDLHPDLPAVRAVGYRQVWDYLEGKLSYQQMTERGIIATRQLAKRQLTWLRSWQGLQWIYSDAPNRCAIAPAHVAGMSVLDAALYYLRTNAN